VLTIPRFGEGRGLAGDCSTLARLAGGGGLAGVITGATGCRNGTIVDAGTIAAGTIVSGCRNGLGPN